MKFPERAFLDLWAEYLADYQKEARRPSFDRWLSFRFKGLRQLGKRDRAWLSDHLFAGLRFGICLAWCADLNESLKDQFLWKKRGDISAAQWDVFWNAQLGKYSDVASLWSRMAAIPPQDWLDWIRARLSPRPTGIMEVLAKRLQDQATRSAEAHWVWSGVPPAVWPALREWPRERAHRFAEMQATRPPLWIRLNHPHQPESKTRITDDFAAVGLRLEFEPDGISARVRGERSIYEVPTFKEGLFEVQDWASQQIGRAIAASPGDFVWDCCAGEGGKTLQIASQLANRGAVYASDIRQSKLDSLKLRVRRAQFFNVRPVPWDGLRLPEFGPEMRQRGGFDVVLVDAPCSSSGTWRRNPELRFRYDLKQIQGFSKLQLELLDLASQAVRPGGRLVYGTCSWFHEENQDVVEVFSSSHPEYELKTQGLHGCPEMDSDTMFSATWQRKPAR